MATVAEMKRLNHGSPQKWWQSKFQWSVDNWKDIIFTSDEMMEILRMGSECIQSVDGGVKERSGGTSQ